MLKPGAGVLFIALVLSLPLAAPAVAASPSTPCWQLLMNQWYQGAITKIFALDCYTEAIQHLPTDIQVYSSARDDITRARNVAIAYDQKQAAAAAAAAATTTTTATTTTAVTTTTATTKKPVAKPIAVPIVKTHGPGSGTSGPLPLAINSASPGGATSFPLPLLILGGLAILLVGAGGIGLLLRRRQSGGPDSS
jgi:hypothetical protein